MNRFKMIVSGVSLHLFIRSAGELIPVEVKGNRNISKSLPHFCAFLLKRYMDKQEIFH